MTSLEHVAERFTAGEPALVAGVDGAGAAVAIAAAQIRPDSLEELHRLGDDMVVLGLEPAIAARLQLATPRARAQRRSGLRLAIPIDAADCRGGWSTGDRAHTIRVAADPTSTPGDLTVPGHVHAAHVDRDGSGMAAVALELARAAEQPAAVVLSAVLDRRGRAVSLAEARRDARLRNLAVAPAEALYGRRQLHPADREAVSCALPTPLGELTILATSTAAGGDVTVTLVHGDPSASERPLVRTHVACLLGDTFGSLLCDCRERLERATREILAAEAGMLVYVKRATGDPFTCPRAAEEPR